MNPLISIVIPTYNRASDLARALGSVFAQTYSSWEALVVDNHSDDNTDDIIKGFNDPRIRLLKINNNGVVAASRNLGIKHAKGEYVAFLDSDDWWTNKKLEESVKYLKKGYELVYHDLFVVTKSGQKMFFRSTNTRDLVSPVFSDLIVKGNIINNSSVVISRKVLNEINGFSEDRALISAEDYDGWLRVAKITERLSRIPKTLGYYWTGGGNIGNPILTLKALDAIGKRYMSDICALDSRGISCWQNYVKGICYYQMASYKEATENFKQVLLQRTAAITKIKSLYMILMGNARSCFGPLKASSL